MTDYKLRQFLTESNNVPINQQSSYENHRDPPMLYKQLSEHKHHQPI